MLKIQRRIQRLEQLSDVSMGPPIEHRIMFVDSDGTVCDELTLTHGPEAKPNATRGGRR